MLQLLFDISVVAVLVVATAQFYRIKRLERQKLQLHDRLAACQMILENGIMNTIVANKPLDTRLEVMELITFQIEVAKWVVDYYTLQVERLIGKGYPTRCATILRLQELVKFYQAAVLTLEMDFNAVAYK